ncbi:MAG: chemotaxis protein CheW [Magnetococcales bacterium]|nr:chemotaxis protein CheW [Magnetococcales bacterium]
MNNVSMHDQKYFIFTVDQIQYGIACNEVVTVTDMPSCTVIPHLPAEVRGVIPFQEENIPVLDLRLCFGLPSRLAEINELINTMALRRQDHLNWMGKLKNELNNQQPISVQTNPHKCAFGQWYDQFESSNFNLAAYMKCFDVPHQAIHRVAVEVTAFLDQGQYQKAQELVARTEGGVLLRLIELFDGIEERVSKYLMEYCIVLQHDAQRFAITVDDLNAFCRLSRCGPLPGAASRQESELIQAIGFYHAEGQSAEQNVLLLESQSIHNILR